MMYREKIASHLIIQANIIIKMELVTLHYVTTTLPVIHGCITHM
jgi:hypothetical protein